jgi:hypothetical protein
MLPLLVPPSDWFLLLLGMSVALTWWTKSNSTSCLSGCLRSSVRWKEECLFCSADLVFLAYREFIHHNVKIVANMSDECIEFCRDIEAMVICGGALVTADFFLPCHFIRGVRSYCSQFIQYRALYYCPDIPVWLCEKVYWPDLYSITSDILVWHVSSKFWIVGILVWFWWCYTGMLSSTNFLSIAGR